MQSNESKSLERILWQSGGKETYTNPHYLQRYLQQSRTINARPYVLPRRFETDFNIRKTTFLNMDYYTLGPENAQKTILYLHGGGYVNQPFDQNWPFIYDISERTNARVIVPIYPKAPNFHATLSFDKVLPLYEQLLETTSPSHMTILGDSAGGGFALALAQYIQEKELPQPQNIVLISPWLDITLRNPNIEQQQLEAKDPMLGVYGLKIMGEAYAGPLALDHYFVSPINGTLNQLGQISVFIGTHDLLLADCQKLQARCIKENIPLHYYEYEGLNHVFPLFQTPESEDAREKIVTLIAGESFKKID